jgi:hypothetical protein
MTKRTFAIKAMMLLGAAVAIGMARPAAAAPFTINFETLPSLPAQPNNFAAAGPMQTYTVPGMFTITGGVVLGNPTFLAAFPAHGTPPNAYGTADFADPSLLPTITLIFPSTENVVSLTGVLFNGQPGPETYVVDAFSGALLVDANTFTNMPASSSTSGFGNFSLSSSLAEQITSVTITTPNADANGWDFFVDTIRVTPVTITAVPEPSTALILLSGVLGLVAARRRRQTTRSLAASRH